MLIPSLASIFARKVAHVCVLTLLASSLPDVCRASSLDHIRKLTKEFLPDTLAQILASIESARGRDDRSFEDGQARSEPEGLSGEADEDRQLSNVDRDNEEYAQYQEEPNGKSLYLQAAHPRQPTHLQQVVQVGQVPQHDSREPRRDRPAKRKKNNQIKLRLKDQISQLSADLFKLDEPLFDDQPTTLIKRVDPKLRNYEASDYKYNIDEIVEKVRARLRKDFERHGYGYLLDDKRQETDVREGSQEMQNYKYDKFKKSDQKDRKESEVLTYAAEDPAQVNVFKDYPTQDNPRPDPYKDENRPYPYANQEKRIAISQEQVPQHQLESRFQVLDQRNLGYTVDAVASEISQVMQGPVYQKQDTGDPEVPGDDLRENKRIVPPGPVYKKEDTEDAEDVGDDLVEEKRLGKKGHDSYEDYVTPKKEANIYASEEVTSGSLRELRNEYISNNNQYDVNPNQYVGNTNQYVGNTNQYNSKTNQYNSKTNQYIGNTNQYYSNGSPYKHYNQQPRGANRGGGLTTPQQVIRPRTTTEPVIDYTEITMADTRSGKHAVTEHMKWDYDDGTLREDRNQTRQRTVLPTKKKFRLQSPNYYISQPSIVEKYNSNEPLPIKDQVPEDRGPKVGLADAPEISINKRKAKKKRMHMTHD